MALLLSFLLSWPNAAVASSMDLALTEAQVTPADPVVTRVALILHLLNDRGYLLESSPDPRYAGFARFQTTSRDEALRLLERYRGPANSGDPYAPYNLDSLRRPDEMLAQRIGGSCGTMALVTASLLIASGVPADDVRVVSAVVNSEYDLLCPNGAGQTRSFAPIGGSGHVFVLLRLNGQWRLINTTFAPIRNVDAVNGRHAQTLRELRRRGASPAEWIAVLRELDESDLEMPTYFSPDALVARLQGPELTALPIFQSLPEVLPGSPPLYFRELSAFLVTTVSDAPLHDFAERFNLIASGSVTSPSCRFQKFAIPVGF